MVSSPACLGSLRCPLRRAWRSAANPSIINTATGCSGQTAWLVTCATGGQTNNSGNQTRMSVLVTDADEQAIASLVTDDDYDGTSDPSRSAAVTAQRPTHRQRIPPFPSEPHLHDYPLATRV